MSQQFVSGGEIVDVSYPTVDYDSHPAFDFDVDASQVERSDAFIDVVARLDALFEPIRHSDTPLSLRQVERQTQATLDRYLNEARDLVHAGQSPRETEALDIGLASAAGELTAEAAFRSQQPVPHRVAQYDTKVARALDEVGAFEYHLDPDRKQRLHEALEPLKQTVGNRPPGTRFYKDLAIVPRGGHEAELLLDLLNEAGIPDGFAEFFGRPAVLQYWTLIRSSPTEVWWQDAYSDVGVPTSPTTYFHIDSGYDGPKVMIYLTEVTEDHGPFEYLPGSHRWERSVSLELLTKEIERAHKSAWVNEDTSYYRPYMQLEEFRRTLMNLPTPVRHQSHFGDDVLEGSEVHKFIDRTKRTVYSDLADCVAFDGNRVTHRGALAEGATRWALQVGFEPAPTRAQSLVRRSRAAAGSIRRRSRTSS